MAFMNQEKKKQIAAELRKVVPTKWKYSLAVRNYSKIVMTISSGPAILATNDDDEIISHKTINEYYLENYFSGTLLETFKEIVAALNLDNFDNSDTMTDYFHVGHYVTLQIGKWDKPYVVR